MSRVAAENLLDVLRKDGLTLGVAESCTGGLIGARLTEVPGSSDTFRGGFIVYDDAVKISALGLDPKRLEKHGAVSAWAVEAMAHAARAKLDVDMALAVSGITGPSGGSLRKPVGTVWIAVAGPGDLLDVKRLKFKGGRDEIRNSTVDALLERALEMVNEAEIEGIA